MFVLADNVRQSIFWCLFFLQIAEHPYTQQESEFRSSSHTYIKACYCDIFTYTYTNIDIYAILILEVPDSMAASPKLNWFCQNLT